MRQGTDFTLSPFGVHGDFADNLLQRLQPVVAERPDVVSVLIGTNDACASSTPRWLCGW
jgi:lysophospholipase L1-like esterase